MQAADTDRTKMDARSWVVQCANLDCRRGKNGARKTFEATRSDASYCSPNCRKYVHNAPKRKATALHKLQFAALDAQDIAKDFKHSQDVYDAMIVLYKSIGDSLKWFETDWKQKTFIGDGS